MSFKIHQNRLRGTQHIHVEFAIDHAKCVIRGIISKLNNLVIEELTVTRISI